MKEPYFTNGIEVNNFDGVRIIGFHGTAAPNNSKASPVSLRDGKDYEITPAKHCGIKGKREGKIEAF